jgi:hypothetical protein
MDVLVLSLPNILFQGCLSYVDCWENLALYMSIGFSHLGPDLVIIADFSKLTFRLS